MPADSRKPQRLARAFDALSAILLALLLLGDVRRWKEVSRVDRGL